MDIRSLQRGALSVFVACALAASSIAVLACAGCAPSPKPSKDTSVWDGTEVDTSWYADGQSTYQLQSAAALAGLAQLVDQGKTFEGATVQLVTNVDLAGHEWNPIGGRPEGNEGVFRGNFDGQNNSITGLYMVSPEGYRGLFASVADGKLENFFLQGSVKGRDSSAGVVCDASDEEFNNIVVDVDIFSTNYYKNVNTAGLCGSYFADRPGEELKITNCVNNGTIEANNYNVAGLIGSAGITDGTTLLIKNCRNQGYLDIDAQDYEPDAAIGGIVSELGSFGTYKVEGCTNTGEVYASDLPCVAGIVGYVGGADTVITGCRNEGKVHTGTLNNKAVAAGIAGVTQQFDSKVTNCSNSGELATFNGEIYDIAQWA